MATKAFDAITLTLYIGLADSWSRGGRKEDNVLAGAHKRRFNFLPPQCTCTVSVSADNCTNTFVITDKEKAFYAVVSCTPGWS